VAGGRRHRFNYPQKPQNTGIDLHGTEHKGRRAAAAAAAAIARV